MSALRGLIVGIIGLSAMQALVSSTGATANATGAIGAAGNVLSRWLDPTVALIPDLRGSGGGTVAIAPASSSSGGGGKYSGAGGAGSSAQVNAWIAEANRILLANGVRPDQLDDDALRVIIQHESGGDPSVVNRWDSNWKAGHPSKGVMQTIDSTFAENALPGWNSNIFDPVSNIIAGVRYALANYGSLSNVPGIRSLRSGGAYKGY